jgi:hypothetical protein
LIRYLGKKISSVFWQGIPPRERERREEKNIKAIGKNTCKISFIPPPQEILPLGKCLQLS